MAWHRIGDKPLSEPMLTWYTDAYMRHYERENELTVLDSTVILLFLTWYRKSINDDKYDNLHTSTPCLTLSVCVLSVHVITSGVQSTIWVNRGEACMFKWIIISKYYQITIREIGVCPAFSHLLPQNSIFGHTCWAPNHFVLHAIPTRKKHTLKTLIA